MNDAADPRELADAVADGQQLDWVEVLRHVEPRDVTVVENLSRISQLMSAHQRLVRESLPFETWGKLRLLERIGEGGYGEVYRAWDESLGREVALKLFRQKQEGVSVRASISERQANDLMLEARRLARVRHENVVRVYGAEEHRGRAGFWMELVEGQTLAAQMHASGTMEASEAAHVGVRLCEGLAAIHAAGMLHRDIKAQNVMRESDGRVVLTDLGAGVDLRFTPSGLPRSIAGTPLYMAPEMLDGRGGGHSADLYSLGILLYHLVTGRFPYENQTLDALRDDHAHDRRTSLLERRSDLPSAFVDVVERATAHDPRNRFQSASDFAEALRPLAGKTSRDGIGAPRTTWQRRSLALVLVAFVAGVAWIGARSSAPDPAALAPTAQEQTRRLTFSGKANFPTWSPDGKVVAYGEDGQVRLMDPQGGPSRRLELPEGRRAVPWAWTPDGRSVLAHCRDSGSHWDIHRIDVVTGGSDRLVEGGMFPDMSPDGRLLAFALHQGSAAHNQGIAIRDLERGTTEIVATAPRPGQAVYKPRFTPDGRRLVYFRWYGFGHDLWVLDLESGVEKRIETGRLRVTGSYCVVDDGEYVLAGAERLGICSVWKIAIDGNEQIALTEGGAAQDMVTSSPDGRSFVFARVSEESKVLYVSVATGAVIVPPLPRFAVRQPMFGPDGEHVYFQALVNGMWQIWQMDRTGSPQSAPVIRDENFGCFAPVPAENGILHLRGDVRNVNVFGEIGWDQWLWSSDYDGSRSECWEEVGGEVVHLAPSGERGGRVLYSNRLSSAESYWIAARGDAPRALLDDSGDREVYAFDWGRDDDEAVFLSRSNSDGTMALETLDLSTGRFDPVLTDSSLPASVAPLTLQSCAAMASSPDGGRVALLLYDAGSSRCVVLEYSHASQVLREVTSFTDEFAPGTMTWSHDGSEVAVTLSNATRDLYLREPMAPEIVTGR